MTRLCAIGTKPTKQGFLPTLIKVNAPMSQWAAASEQVPPDTGATKDTTLLEPTAQHSSIALARNLT